MSKYTEQLLDFHKSFKQVINETPTIPDIGTCLLRLGLILEELTELAEGMGPEAFNKFQKMLYEKSEWARQHQEQMRERLVPSKVGSLDALCDLQYVLSGTIIAMGMQGVFDKAFDEVHSSNMSKASKTDDHAHETSILHADKGDENVIEEHDGVFLCFRKKDKKLLKSIAYRPANLEQFIPVE